MTLCGAAAHQSSIAADSKKSIEQALPPDQVIEITGKCLKCLIEVRNDMKRNHEHSSIDYDSLDELSFNIIEKPKFFQISVTQHACKTGSIRYQCSKSSGAILDRHVDSGSEIFGQHPAP